MERGRRLRWNPGYSDHLPFLYLHLYPTCLYNQMIQKSMFSCQSPTLLSPGTPFTSFVFISFRSQNKLCFLESGYDDPFKVSFTSFTHQQPVLSCNFDWICWLISLCFSLALVRLATLQLTERKSVWHIKGTQVHIDLLVDKSSHYRTKTVWESARRLWSLKGHSMETYVEQRLY